VELGAVDRELRHRAEHHLVEQAGPVGIEQREQRSSHPVVVQERDLAGIEPEGGRVERSCPLFEGIDRLPMEDQVSHQHPERLRRSELHPAVSGDEGSQQVCRLEPGEVGVDNRHGTEELGLEVERTRITRHACGHVWHLIQ
jgi:hypothetical protein